MGAEKRRILLVDDDEDFIAATRTILESRSYEVVQAGNSEAGFAVMERAAPDLVILDMMMERKGAGFLFSRRMRKDRRFDGVPILMLTGMRSQTGFFFPGKDKDPVWLPVDEFAEKPMKPEDLLAAVERLLKRQAGG